MLLLVAFAVHWCMLFSPWSMCKSNIMSGWKVLRLMIVMFCRVKTRIQLNPSVYNCGIWEGKFGGYEFFKRRITDLVGHEMASRNRNAIYLTASASAEALGDVLLCPFEAIRIWLVSELTYARGFVDGFRKMAIQEGVPGLYSGLGPILLKQYVVFFQKC